MMKNWLPMLAGWDTPADKKAVSLARFLRAKAGRNVIIREKSIKAAASLINRDYPEIRGEIIRDANKALSLNARLFGSEYDLKTIARKYGRPGRCGLIPWFHDLKTGDGFYPEPVTLKLDASKSPSDEIKFMLDLPRLQWVTPLGEAYALTGDEKYARCCMKILDDFFDHVPPGAGIPWANAMDNGIRVTNMLVLWQFFRASPLIDDRFVLRFWKSVLAHVREILNWAEDWPIEPPHPMAELDHVRAAREKHGEFRLLANHYLGGRTGLWAALNALPEHPGLHPHLETVKGDMEREVIAETLPEGMNFEASTHYHRLTTEFFLCWAAVCRNRGINIPADRLTRFRKQFEFVRDITRPDGLMPQVGDMDNGRMHIFGYGDWRDVRYLTQLGACYFNDRSLLAPGTRLSRYALWHFGPMAERFRDPAGEIKLKSRVFKRTGISVLRRGDAYAALFALKNGQAGAGGHSHEDKLEVEYCIGNRSILVDPGQGIYLSDMKLRKFFRSAKNHSVLTVDGAEINPIHPDYPWYVPDNADARLVSADLRRNLAAGEHDGFKRLSGTGRYRREIMLQGDGSLVINDSLAGSGKHRLEWRFVLAPDIRVSLKKSGRLAVMRDGAGQGAVLELAAEIAGKIKLGKGKYAYEYGRWSNTPVLLIEITASLPLMRRFVFRPL